MPEIKFYWQLVLRRLPILIAIVIMCAAVGLLQAIRLPATYEASARLLYEGPIVEGNDDAFSADEEIQIIREQLLTRPNLLEIAQDFDVFEDYSAIPTDDIITRMRNNSTINSRGGRNQATLINVSFSARSGQIAADVVNEYVTRVINASVERRTDFDENNLDFYEQEVERLSDDLSTRSAQISQFRTENADALPDDQNFRLTRQATLQERLTSAQRELSSLIDQRARIIQIYEQTGQISTTETVLSDDQRQLRDLERELAQALTIYSESAPRIVTLRRRIDQLRALVAASSPEDAPANPGQAVLDLQLSQLDVQINELESVIDEASTELERLEEAIRRTPLVSVTLDTMARDYENVRSLYDRAADNLQQAQIDLRITVTNRGERITLVEAASVPRSPSSPNRKLIAFLGGVAGIGLAGGLFLLLEILNRTVRRPADIQRALGIEPLATVPYIENARERLNRTLRRAVALVLVIVGIPAGLWALHSFVMPLDLLANEVLGRIGLT
ncbi:MAG: lipopolysaccharide biosynthesis [Pseudomonadota bacterium]